MAIKLPGAISWRTNFATAVITNKKYFLNSSAGVSRDARVSTYAYVAGLPLCCTIGSWLPVARSTVLWYSKTYMVDLYSLHTCNMVDKRTATSWGRTPWTTFPGWAYPTKTCSPCSSSNMDITNDDAHTPASLGKQFCSSMLARSTRRKRHEKKTTPVDNSLCACRVHLVGLPLSASSFSALSQMKRL